MRVAEGSPCELGAMLALPDQLRCVLEQEGTVFEMAKVLIS